MFHYIGFFDKTKKQITEILYKDISKPRREQILKDFFQYSKKVYEKQLEAGWILKRQKDAVIIKQGITTFNKQSLIQQGMTEQNVKRAYSDWRKGILEDLQIKYGNEIVFWEHKDEFNPAIDYWVLPRSKKTFKTVINSGKVKIIHKGQLGSKNIIDNEALKNESATQRYYVNKYFNKNPFLKGLIDTSVVDKKLLFDERKNKGLKDGVNKIQYFKKKMDLYDLKSRQEMLEYQNQVKQLNNKEELERAKRIQEVQHKKELKVLSERIQELEKSNQKNKEMEVDNGK